jgi:hypothetical protein
MADGILALDRVQIVHSTRFPTLCTLAVGAQVQDSPVSAHSPKSDQSQWVLPVANARDESRRLFRLHTLDIYFWTLEDANLFLDSVEKVLSPRQLESDRHPQHQAPEPALSTVVRNLENVAISDPAYQNGQTRDSRSQPAVAETQSITHEAPKEQAPTGFVPLAYNPAAPAPPEVIKHREKAPPPIDGTEGTGLEAAVMADSSQLYGHTQIPGAHNTQAQAVPGLAQFGYGSPPPSAGLGPPTFGAPPSVNAVPTPAGGTSFAPPPQDPNAHLHGQQAYGSHHVQQSRNPQYADYLQSQGYASEDHQVPIGGYSNYSYSQPVQQHHGTPVSEYDIHSQVYRPTEAEARSHSQKHAKQAMKNPGARHHKLEENAGKVENKVNGFLKKLEKKIG